MPAASPLNLPGTPQLSFSHCPRGFTLSTNTGALSVQRNRLSQPLHPWPHSSYLFFFLVALGFELRALLLFEPLHQPLTLTLTFKTSSSPWNYLPSLFQWHTKILSPSCCWILFLLCCLLWVLHLYIQMNTERDVGKEMTETCSRRLSSKMSNVTKVMELASSMKTDVSRIEC
jgi:hypothetical protein